MNPIVALIDLILSLASLAVFVYVILQLLIRFDVINTSNNIVQRVFAFLGDLIEPLLAKIRKYVKPYNNIDLSPLVLLIIIWFLRYTIVYCFA